MENNDIKEFDKALFKSAVESLIYLSRCTCPDISFVVSKVSRCSEHPSSAGLEKGNKYFKIFKLY